MNFTIGGGSGTCSETSLSIIRPSLFLSSYPHRQHLEQLQIINMKKNTNVKDELPSPDSQKDMSGIMWVTLDGSKSKSCLPWYCTYYEWSRRVWYKLKLIKFFNLCWKNVWMFEYIVCIDYTHTAVYE